MLISNVKIKNYRGLKGDEFEASPFNCAIGENNAGKSTILLAISLFFSGSSLNKSDFFDENDEIEIELTFSEILEGDILRLNSDHRERIKELINNDLLKLTRLYSVDGKSELLCQRLVPKDNRFDKAVIIGILKGKSGKELTAAISSTMHEYAEQFIGLTTQKAIFAKLDEIILRLDASDLEMRKASLPTGIENSIRAFLPDPIYIAAVKDLRDDVKAKESTTFGKLLAILLKFLERSSHLDDILKSFDQLHALFNVINEEGVKTDIRIDRLRQIENQITSYLKENFPKSKVEIEIPKPELRQIFSNAKILIDDGVKDVIETKGDGIKRAVTFALLRTYVEQLKIQKQEQQSEKDTIQEGDGAVSSPTAGKIEQPYVFLFEEPELFLHPSAQKVLFEALESLTLENNQVFVTTHSPTFFSPYSTGTFIKVVKEYPSGCKPFGKFIFINLLKNIGAKDAFQILCYENNAAAFFSSKVLLVEGDSDLIYLKEISRMLNPNWNFDNKNIPIISINGKSNVKRFVEFYKHFQIQSYTIVDSDALIDGFDKFSVCDISKEKRSQLLQLLDRLAVETLAEVKLSSDKIKQIIGQYSWQEKYDRLKTLAKRVQKKEEITEAELSEIDNLFTEESNNLRRQILTRKDLNIEGKLELLELLRQQNIFILSNGSIENYYPSGMTGADKPAKALNAIRYLKEQADCRTHLPVINREGKETCELEIIFEKIFE